MMTAGLALLLMLLSVTPLTQATPTAADQPAIPPVVWELVEISGTGDDPLVIAEPGRYTIQFRPDGTLAVAADCNQAAGTFTAEDDALDVTIVASTLVLCPRGSQSETFVALLDGATAYEFAADGLLNIAGANGTLRLQAALTGVRWEWQSFRGGDDSYIAPKQPKDYSLTFLPGGKLAIQADCNRMMGRFATDGPTLELMAGDPHSTCSSRSLADRFLRDLDAVSSHVFRDGNLYLSLWADAGILEFAARYDQPSAATPQAG